MADGFSWLVTGRTEEPETFREWCSTCLLECGDDPDRAADGTAICSAYCRGRRDEAMRNVIDWRTALFCEGHGHV